MEINFLKGDPEENFYQLGLKDSESYSDLYQHLLSLYNLDNSIIQELTKLISSKFYSRGSYLFDELSAYAEGLGISIAEFLVPYVLPETVSGLNKINPSALIGCSSLFYLDDKSLPHHLRIFDYPINLTFQEYENINIYEFSDNKSLSFGASGIPIPYITSCNSSGLSFALHQKILPIFNKSGRPIFELMSELTFNAEDISDCKKMINEFNSIASWGIKILSSKDNKVLSVDVVGEESANIKEIELNEKDFIYINNLPSTKDHYDSPWMKNFNWHCHERSKQAKQNLKGMRKKSFNNVYKKLTNVDDKKKDFSLFPVNPTTTQIIDFNLSEEKITFPKKGVPRGFEQEGYQVSSFWSSPKPKMDEIKLYRGKANMEMSAFYRELILCQSAWDKKDINSCFHHIQMAIKVSPNKYYKATTTFFRVLFSLMQVEDKYLLEKEYFELKNIAGDLPEIFDFDFDLLLFRLQKLIGETPMITESIESTAKVETKIPLLFYQNYIKRVTFPRLDIFDVLYVNISNLKP